MLQPLRTIKILLLCFAMYMLMVLPVFADGVYKLPTTPAPVPHATPPMAPIPSMHRPVVPPQNYYVRPTPPAAVAPMRTVNPNAQPGYVPYGGMHQVYVPYTTAPHTYAADEAIWMQHGGARLQYDALPGPTQMYTNGRPVLDPANVHLPPLYPHRVQKAQTRRTRRTYHGPQPITTQTPVNAVWKVGTKAHTLKPATQPIPPAPIPPAPVQPTPAPSAKVKEPAQNTSPYDGPASPVGGNSVRKIES